MAEQNETITSVTTKRICSYIKERGLNERIVRLLVAEAVVKAKYEGIQERVKL